VYSGFEPALDDGMLVRPLETLSKSGILQFLSSKRLLMPSVSPCVSDSCQCSLFGMGKDRFFTNCSAQLVPAPVEFVAVPRPSGRRGSRESRILPATGINSPLPATTVTDR